MKPVFESGDLETDTILETDESKLVFERGCLWMGTFVKRARFGYREISFHLATHIVVNCLPLNPTMPGPLGTVQSNDAAIETACLRAFARARQATAVLLSIADFEIN